MKKLALKYTVLSMLLLLAMDLSAKKSVEKRKVIEKSYTVAEHVKLNLENKFGRVHVNTTMGNEVVVKVEIIVRKNSESKAMSLLDQIDIEISESSDEISFLTQMNGSIKNRGSENYEINYLVKMPISNPLAIKNSFGDTYVSDFQGDLKMKIAYGDVKTESLSGDADIKVSFGDGSFKRIEKGGLEIKYSDVSFGYLGSVRLVQGFSDVEIEEAETIDLSSKYGDVTIGKIKGLKGTVGYSDLDIDYLQTELDVETNYAGDLNVSTISNKFRKVSVIGKFSPCDLGFEAGANGEFQVYTKYGDFDYDESIFMVNYQNKSDQRSTYKGVIGNGKGGIVIVETTYSDVDLN